MQIDFHHTATYVIARYAGFAHRDAEIIAYCAQYVDDATNEGTTHFDNGAMYHRVASAHKMLDYSNFKKLANHQVWIPFHFLPGNGGLRAGENPRGTFIDKIACKPNSCVALDMVVSCIREQDTPYGLHRLGITMHVYADTWAHQGGWSSPSLWLSSTPPYLRRQEQNTYTSALLPSSHRKHSSHGLWSP